MKNAEAPKQDHLHPVSRETRRRILELGPPLRNFIDGSGDVAVLVADGLGSLTRNSLKVGRAALSGLLGTKPLQSEVPRKGEKHSS